MFYPVLQHHADTCDLGASEAALLARVSEALLDALHEGLCNTRAPSDVMELQVQKLFSHQRFVVALNAPVLSMAAFTTELDIIPALIKLAQNIY